MRTIFVLLCIALSIKFISNSQCASHPNLAGPCGCCPLIGGSCIPYNTIDGIDVSWHVCVPEYLKSNFSLELCQSNFTMATGLKRFCRTKYGLFPLFHQCVMKEQCRLAVVRKQHASQCHTPMAVKGSCDKSYQRFSYDAQHNKCVPFIYSGCGGTTNNFYRQDKCEKLCIKST